MRLLIIQHTGDYRESFRRFCSGGRETYYAQKYSVESVAKLTQYADEVAYLCCVCETAYDETLENGVRAISAGFRQQIDPQQLIQLIEGYRPTHIVLCTLIPDVLRWATKHQIPTIATLANALHNQGFLRKVRNLSLVKLLNHPSVEWIGSYGLNSSKQLHRMGVQAKKIVPWDFLIDPHPGDFLPKSLPSGKDSWQLCYVGSVSAAKGVGDILEAVAALKAQQFPVHLKLVGSDSAGFAAENIARLGISDRVELLGILPNDAIEPLMNASDLVLVPSRHDYVEGFPLVIHHALRSQTPIVASDHPMFKHYLRHGVNAMIFPACNIAALSARIQEVLTNPTLYQQISQASHSTWHQLRLPVKWGDLMQRWVSQQAEDRQFLASHSLVGQDYTLPATSARFNSLMPQ